jgi:hypothetical protein
MRKEEEEQVGGGMVSEQWGRCRALLSLFYPNNFGINEFPLFR